MRELGGFARQNVADDERFQFAEQAGADAVLRDVLAENDQRLDFALLDAARNFRNLLAHFFPANSHEPRTV